MQTFTPISVAKKQSIPEGKKRFSTNLSHEMCSLLRIKAKARRISQSHLMERLVGLLHDPEIDAKV